MKRSSLTKAQQVVLESLLARYGLVVTSDQVAQAVAHLAEQSQRRFISTLVDAGWLVRIRYGLYQIADLSSLSTLTLSRLTIAQLLVPTSYVSFQSALNYHGLFNQGLKSVTSVALTRHAPVTLEGTTYSFVTTQERFFFGFEETLLDGKRVRVATPEKAILDLLQFKRTHAAVDLVLEILREQAHHLDLERLARFATRLPISVQQVTGFLLEAAGQTAAEALVASVQQGTGVTWLTPESTRYHHRWRLYSDPAFTTTEAFA